MDYELAKIRIWPDYNGPCDFFLPLAHEGEAASPIKLETRQ